MQEPDKEKREEIAAVYGPILEELRDQGFAKGGHEYGALQFLAADGATLQQVKEEIADAMNWLELLFYKLSVLEDAMS